MTERDAGQNAARNSSTNGVHSEAATGVYPIDYILEKFRTAIWELVTGERDARTRVGNAYYKFWHIKPKDLPDSLREKREEIDRILTRLPGREGYIIPDNLRRMKNKTASRIAAIILKIYLELSKYRGK